MVICISGLFRLFSRLRGVVPLSLLRHPQEQATSPHPIQRKEPSKVARNLMGNGIKGGMVSNQLMLA